MLVFAFLADSLYSSHLSDAKPMSDHNIDLGTQTIGFNFADFYSILNLIYFGHGRNYVSNYSNICLWSIRNFQLNQELEDS